MNAQPVDDLFLHPGEFFFGAAPGRIGTLLGSCVSVTLWHPGRRIGGMCHILLSGRRRASGEALDPRYADETIELFSRELRLRRVAPQECEAKLFGGGRMFSGQLLGPLEIGRRNIEAARGALVAHGLLLVAEHVGGTCRRRLNFDLSTGAVWLRAHDEAGETLVESA
jgi:chemotaxis protein CheD